MSIIHLLKDLTDAIEQANGRAAKSSGFCSVSSIAVNSPYSSLTAPTNKLNRPNLAEHFLETSEPIFNFGEPSSSTVSDGLDPLDLDLAYSLGSGFEAVGCIPGVFECANGLNNISNGLRTQDSENILLGSEQVLKFCTGAVTTGLKFAEVSVANFMAPGIGGAFSLLELIDGIQWLYRTYGRRVAAQSLFALLIQSSNLPLSSSFKQTHADLKLSYFSSLDPFMASMHWVAYKYRPHWLLEAQNVIHRIGIPLFGLAAAVLTLVIIAGSISTWGAVPLVLISLSAAAGLGFLFYRSGKYLQSKQIYIKNVEPLLSPQIKYEIHACLRGSHRLFGATIGDYFRYCISCILFEDLHGIKRTPHKPAQQLYSQIAPVTDTLHGAMIDSVWDIMRHDLGHREFTKMLTEVSEVFYSQPSHTSAHTSSTIYSVGRLNAIQILFRSLKINIS